MSVDSINSQTNAAQAGSVGAGSQKDPSFQLPVVKQDFLKILVHQMKNQDPFSASGSDAFLNQMAQFSSLEQMQNLTSTLTSLLGLQNQNAAIQDLSTGSSLIGHEIVYTKKDGNEGIGIVNSVSFGADGTFLNTDAGDHVPLFAVKGVQKAPVSSEG